MTDVGIRSSIIKGSFNADSLSLFAEAGFHIIELSFNAPGVHLDYLNKVLGRSIQKRGEQLSMKILAHAPYKLSLTSPDQAVVNMAVEEYLHVLEGAVCFGARRLVIHACVERIDEMTQKRLRISNLLQALRRIERCCAERRIELAVETMIPGRLTSDIDLLVNVIEQIDSPWVGICLDTNHVNLSHSVHEAIIKGGRQINEIHANDNHGVEEEHLLPYFGVINWLAVVKAIDTIHFQGDIIMEPNHHKGKSDHEMLACSHAQAEKLLQELKNRSAS